MQTSLARRLGSLAFAFVVAAPLVGTGARPAAAATTTTGAAEFAGTASLPKFPCQPPPPFGDGPCDGSFRGDWSGHISGVSGTSPFEATWHTGTGLEETPNSQIEVPTVTYAEWDCNLGVAETLLGIARGTGTATAGPGQIDGNWQVVGETFARDITGVRLTFAFKWTRLVTSAVITLEPATLELNVTGMGWVVVSRDLPQVAVAGFVPTETEGEGVPSCENQEAVTGVIAGVLNLDGAA